MSNPLEIYQRSLKNRKIKPSSISEIATPTAQESDPETPLPNLAELYKAGSQIGQMGDVAPHQGTWTPVVPPIQGAAPKQYNEFESWYLDQFGEEYNGNFSASKPDDMDYNTWQTGQTLYNLYNTEKQAGEAYGQRIGAIDKQADYQNQQAYILAQKLQKYLGLTAAAQGQKGIAAGDLIAAQTDYQNRLAGIATTAEGYRQEAHDTKQNVLSAAQSGTQNQLSQLYAQQEAGETANQEQRYATETANQERWYETVLGTIENKAGLLEVNEDTGAYSYEDWQSLWKLYEDNKGKMSESQQQMMEFYLKNLDHEEAVEDETSDGGLDEVTLRDFIKSKTNMVINGKEYSHPLNVQIRATLITKKTLADGDYYKADNGKEYIYYNKFLYRIEPTA